MSLSELQRRHLIVKFCLENPNKSQSETVEHLQRLGCKIPTIYRTIKRLEKQEKAKRKIGSEKKCANKQMKQTAKLGRTL
jgi:DNA-binding MarR family transcriptional regulator